MLRLALLLALVFAGVGATDIAKVSQSKEAYATLLYGDPYVLGVRVLGQSLRESGTTKDMVALVTGPLSASAEMTLMMDGWRVMRVHPVVNPGKGPEGRSPKRFWAVYTKLLIFQLTEYRKVIFMDADILVIKNMDVLFGCPGFCAALRHSERFNSGVMALVPGQEIFDDMMGRINAMPSYTGGDQGFLNSYFAGFAGSPLFNPLEAYRADEHKYMRLPTVFNADVGLYIVGGNRWMIPRETLHCIHFTLGALKPWVWYTSWLVGETDTWQGYRYRLPADSNGVQYGRTSRQQFAETWLLVLPPALVGYLVWRLLHSPHALLQASSSFGHHHDGGSRKGHPQHSTSGGAGAGLISGALSLTIGESLKSPHAGGGGGGGGGLGLERTSIGGLSHRSSGGNAGGLHLPHTAAAAAALVHDCVSRMFALVSLGAGYLSVLLAMGCTLVIVPPEVAPVFGWILSYQWGFLIFAACYGAFLRLCLQWGRHSHHSHGTGLVAMHHKHAPRPWSETAVAASIFVAFAVVVPWTGSLLGVRAPIARVLVTVALAVVGNLALTVQFLLLPSHWYNTGRLECGDHRYAD